MQFTANFSCFLIIFAVECKSYYINMNNILRKEYLKQLSVWKDKQVIKVITGVRRSGKSTLLRQFQQQLIDSGVHEKQIQSINFEDLANEHLLDYRVLYKHILNDYTPGVRNYIFLDEIQMVSEFQRAVDSLLLKEDMDIYITGSNAYLLSSEIATLLSGRYVELRLLPLSFAEYLSAFSLSKEDAYRKYISETSFPYGIQLSDANAVREYISGLYSTVVLKDIVSRKKLQDMDLLERIRRFLSDNIGNITSVKNITNNLLAGGRKVSDHTVENYLYALMECYLFYRVERYDVQGKQRLKVGHKYYITDLGLRHFLLGIRNNDLGHLLENTVYLELLRRGYQVMVGKMGDVEIDFIAFKSGFPEYYQVSLSVREASTLQRELAPFLQVNDHYPKYLLTLDNDPLVVHNGIRQVYALDWLQGE